MNRFSRNPKSLFSLGHSIRNWWEIRMNTKNTYFWCSSKYKRLQANPAFISSNSLMQPRGWIKWYKYQFINKLKRKQTISAVLFLNLSGEFSCPRDNGLICARRWGGRGHCWSQLINLCLTEMMIIPFSLLFCGLVSVFRVYSLNSKLEEALVIDYSSSIL